MVEWIGVAVGTMVCAVLIQHLGLTVAMADVARKIASCYKCCTFWSCLAVLVFLGVDILHAAALSIFMSYLSHYFALLLMVFQKAYDWLWQKISKK